MRPHVGRVPMLHGAPASKPPPREGCVAGNPRRCKYPVGDTFSGRSRCRSPNRRRGKLSRIFLKARLPDDRKVELPRHFSQTRSPNVRRGKPSRISPRARPRDDRRGRRSRLFFQARPVVSRMWKQAPFRSEARSLNGRRRILPRNPAQERPLSDGRGKLSRSAFQARHLNDSAGEQPGCSRGQPRGAPPPDRRAERGKRSRCFFKGFPVNGRSEGVSRVLHGTFPV